MAKKVKPPPPTYAPISHIFLERVTPPHGDGPAALRRWPAKIIYGTDTIEMLLTEDHVKRALVENGCGNTARCAGAQCTYDHRALLPFKIRDMLWVDWTNTRVFIASKFKNKVPVECVCYDHGHRKIVIQNDTTGGLMQLLERIRKTGPIKLTLKPHRPRSAPGHSGPHGVTSGERLGQKRGAALRYATAYGGAMPGSFVIQG